MSTLPLVSILIELNYKVPFPNWLWELETYFKEMEDAARKFSGSLLTFNSFKDLVIAIFVIALSLALQKSISFVGWFKPNCRMS